MSLNYFPKSTSSEVFICFKANPRINRISMVRPNEEFNCALMNTLRGLLLVNIYQNSSLGLPYKGILLLFLL